ncbi:hypothetical protein AB0942_33305 [Streptomyces nodosus]|uniref:hypothetical protein n=1 Tax=Streptomyces nodosus TaxID=40318 RepID=UPI00345124A4
MTTPHCPTGPGGNLTIVNQDQQNILDATVAAVPVRGTALGVEDDSHVSPLFRGGDVAGS